jgi:hypothetical protein
MEWDLGFRGVALLLAMAFGLGVVVQLAWRAMPHWLWIAATALYFVSGVFVSEVWFGWATEDDLQPNIDGLSFDEVMLLATLISAVVVLVAWSVGRRLGGTRHVAS